MRNKVFETVALTTITGGLAYYLRPEMSQVWDIILEAPRRRRVPRLATGQPLNIMWLRPHIKNLNLPHIFYRLFT